MLAPPSVVKILMRAARDNTTYDTLIVGQSHGETSFDPFVLSDNLDCEAFNLARRMMPVENLGYILEEANAHGRYRRVILEIDPSYWSSDHKGSFGADTNLLFRLTGSRWLDYFVNVLMNDNYNSLFADYNVAIYTAVQIPQNLKCKLTKGYIFGNEESLREIYKVLKLDNFEYIGRGFRYGQKYNYAEWPEWDFREDEVLETNLSAFNKIVKYCSENSIELICVQSALPPFRLRLQNGHMDEAHEYYTKLCNDKGVPFYDLNYLKEEYLPRTDDDYVDMDGHMMGELADRQSAVLCEIINSDDPSAFFYDSYDEVLSHLH